jgi:uncharacterized phiE125 gp8 family phage protein
MPLTPIVNRDTEVKPFLKITQTDTDTLLDGFIATASQMIVNRVGQVAGSPTVDEWHDGGGDRIVLRNAGPIQSVTTVTESYGTITYTLTQVTLDQSSTSNAYTYTVDLNDGVLVRRASGIAVPFASGVRNVHVSYVAGYATTPADIKHACLLRIKILWNAVRGNKTGTGPDSLALEAEYEAILARYQVPGIA